MKATSTPLTLPSHLSEIAQSSYELIPVRRLPLVTNQWGWLPQLSVINALGLLLIALANRLAFLQYPEVLFWLGLLVMQMPIVARLLMIEPTRRERMGLVLWLGVGLYFIKVMHSPFAFTYSDEFLHLYNTQSIIRHQALFTPNPILPVSPLYPGLGLVTIALGTLSDAPLFYAGLVVIGCARLVLYLAIYLLMEEVSQSSRVASIATILYMCHSNFLFWSAQFSYESVSLPLAVGVILLTLRREKSATAQSFLGYSLLICMVISTIVVIHHLTSYFVAGFLGAWWVLVYFRLNDRVVQLCRVALTPRIEKWLDSLLYWGQVPVPAGPETYRLPAPTQPALVGGLAMFAIAAALCWLFIVAYTTSDYLSMIFTKAMVSILGMIIGEESGRQLFVSNTGYVAPVWERALGFGSVLLCLLGLPFGLWQIWRQRRYGVIELLLVIMAIGYFAMFLLRFTSAGWETGNRASAYLHIGLSFTLAVGIAEYWFPRRAHWLAYGAGATYVAIIFLGGIIAGWSPQLRLSQPYLVGVAGHDFPPQGVVVSQWVQEMLGPDNHIATDEVNGRYLLTVGDQYPLAGRRANIKDLLQFPELPSWQREIIMDEEIRYVLVDRRRIAWDNMAGYFHDRQDEHNDPQEKFFDPEIAEKFNLQPGVDRLLDSGNIVLYDVEVLLQPSLDQ